MASTSRRLDVEHVQTLVEASFQGLRISVTGGGVTSRDLLTGNFESQALVPTVRRPGRVRDLVGTYWAGVYLVSEHFRRSVTRLGASGWSTSPVPVEGIDFPLGLLSITGTCGSVRGVGGEPIEGGPTFGTFIDPAEWDGTDFFMAENSNAIFVLGSTAKSIHRLHLSNVAFESSGLQPYPTT